jgi:hypothetical protein
MKLLLALLIALSAAGPATAGISARYTADQTLYAHVQTSASTVVHSQLTDGSGQLDGCYTVTDAELADDGLTTDCRTTIYATGFPFAITTSATSSADPIAVDVLDWDGDSERTVGDLTTNEVQTITITGSPTGGTFTLTYDGETTSPIAYNASAAAVDAALEALSNISLGDVTCSGGALPSSPVIVTFTGALAGTDVPEMTANGAGLTGGSSPEVEVTTTTPGLGSTAPVAPTSIVKSRTWFFGASGWRADNIVTVKRLFAGTLAANVELNEDFDIDRDETITVTITDPDDDPVVATDFKVTGNGRTVHFDVPELTVTGDYTVVVTPTSLDGQTIPLECLLRVR